MPKSLFLSKDYKSWKVLSQPRNIEWKTLFLNETAAQYVFFDLKPK